MGTLTIMGPKGHETKTWDVTIQETVDEAQRQFGQLIQEGYTAIRTKGNRPEEVISEFDPQAEEITFIPHMSGG